MKPTATNRTIPRRIAGVAAGAARQLRPVLARKGTAPVLVLVLLLALGAQGYLAFEPKLAGNDQLTGRSVSMFELQALQSAALSCPSLTASRLAGQVMATSGFDAQAAGTGDASGLAGFDTAKWRTWQPWADAPHTDPQANIIALAHQTCQMVGELRAVGVPGDPWRSAVAATRVGVAAVVKVNGVPAAAQTYVDHASAYADWYAQQPEFGGAASTASVPPMGPGPALAGPTPLPKQYVADVLAAGRICTTVTPARIAAQLMVGSGFDPNRQTAGAQGIAQFQPAVWAAYAGTSSASVSPWNPDAAIPMLGTAMCDLSGQLSALTSGDPYTLALAAFQWGATAVREAGGMPQSSVLQDSTDKVLSYVAYYAKDSQLNPAPPASPTPSRRSPSPSSSPSPKTSARPPHPNGPTIDPAGFYQIENAWNGLVLDVPGNDSEPGAGVVIQQWHNQRERAKDQFWTLVPIGSTGYYRIINRYSGKALAAQGGSKADGAKIVGAWPDNNAASEQWRFRDAGGGAYWIVNRNSGKRLDVYGDDIDTSDGGTIDQWRAKNESKDERWLLTR